MQNIAVNALSRNKKEALNKLNYIPVVRRLTVDAHTAHQARIIKN